MHSWEQMNTWKRWVRISKHRLHLHHPPVWGGRWGWLQKSWLRMDRWQRGRLLQSDPHPGLLLSPHCPDFSGPFSPPATIWPSALTSLVDLCSMYPENLSNMVFAAFPMSTLVFISSMNSSWLMRCAFPFQKPRCHYLTPCLPSFPAPQGLHK